MAREQEKPSLGSRILGFIIVLAIIGYLLNGGKSPTPPPLPDFLRFGEPIIESEAERGIVLVYDTVLRSPNQGSDAIAFVQQGKSVRIITPYDLTLSGQWLEIKNARDEIGYIASTSIARYFLSLGTPSIDYEVDHGTISSIEREIIRDDDNKQYFVLPGDIVKVLTPYSKQEVGAVDQRLLYVENLENMRAYISEEFVQRNLPYFLDTEYPPAGPNEQYGVVTSKKSDTIFIRRGKNSYPSGAPIAYVNNGDTLRILTPYNEFESDILTEDSSLKWLKVMNAKNEYGYISQNLKQDRVKRFITPPISFAVKVLDDINSNWVNVWGISLVEIRTSPSIQSSSIARAEPGDWLKVERLDDLTKGPIDKSGKNGQWLKVFGTYNTIGFVEKELVAALF